jgi:hypothetical protein
LSFALLHVLILAPICPLFHINYSSNAYMSQQAEFKDFGTKNRFGFRICNFPACHTGLWSHMSVLYVSIRIRTGAGCTYRLHWNADGTAASVADVHAAMLARGWNPDGSDVVAAPKVATPDVPIVPGQKEIPADQLAAALLLQGVSRVPGAMILGPGQIPPDPFALAQELKASLVLCYCFLT